jgi:hypothetical protein
LEAPLALGDFIEEVSMKPKQRAAQAAGTVVGGTAGYFAGRAINARVARSRCKRLHPDDPQRYKQCVYDSIKQSPIVSSKYAQKQAEK